MNEPQQPTVQPADTERHMLESENLRRRQLRSALLHGSGSTWRKRHRVWPAALSGIVIAAIIVAIIGVSGAFQRQQSILDEEQKRRQPVPTATR